MLHLFQGRLSLSKSRAKARKMKLESQNENTIKFNAAPQKRRKHVDLIPKSLGQEKLILQLQDEGNHIVVAVGPAGTGKTYVAMQAAIKDFQEGVVNKIVLTRPAVGVEDEQHGFLPGDINKKMEPWTRPLLDVLKEHYHPREIVSMIDDGVIEISPLAYMRGRTFKNSWIVADEMQNATPAQVKMLCTRIGSYSKIAITGDVEQADKKGDNNGLLDLCLKLNANPKQGIAISEMTRKDIQRHPIIDTVLNLYQD